MMSKVMMADELTNLQDIYLHAVTRHVLLQREADAFLASRKTLEGDDASGEKASSGEGPGAMETPRPRRRHRRRRRESEEERRARLLEVARRLAPAVGFRESEGSLKGIR